jgi:hypothetical protein
VKAVEETIRLRAEKLTFRLELAISAAKSSMMTSQLGFEMLIKYGFLAQILLS